MEDKKWFILVDERVSGPLSLIDIEEKLKSNKENKYKIWWRGMNEWVNEEHWRKHLQSDQTQDDKKERLWRIKIGDDKLPNMNHDQMMAYLKEQKDFSNVKVWTEGYKEWKEVFHIHQIMDELGISRRQHPRVPIMGTIIFETSQGKLQFKASTISEGGFGLTGAQNLKIGTKLRAHIESPNLYLKINCTAEILYISNTGNTGCKFVGIQPEFKSAIIEYVKKFSEANVK